MRFPTWLISIALASSAAPAIGAVPVPGPSIDAVSGAGVAARGGPESPVVAAASASLALADSGTHVLSTTARRFALVGVPLIVSDASPRAVFADLGVPSDTTWRLGHWSAADSAYQDAADGSLGAIAPGLGYWLVTESARTVSIAGQQLPRDTFEIALSAGPGGRPAWNALANPFLSSLPMSRLVVVRGGTRVALESPANTLTERTVQVWNPTSGAYAPASVIPPGGGFWIKRLGTGGIRLRVLPEDSATATRAAATEATSKPEGAQWAVALAASQDDREAQPLILGAAADAGDGWNPLCASRPPAPPGRYLSLHVPRPDWGDYRGDYVRDLRALDAPAEWTLALSGAIAPGEVRIAAAAFDLPDGTRLLLSDPREGWTRELVPGGSLTLAATPDERRLDLRVIGGDPGDLDASAAAPRVYPSPFTGAAGVVLSLARAGELALDVYDPQGRRVRSLVRAGLEPGEHVLVWDGRDARGRLAPPGVYLGRWKAGDRQGAVRLVKVR